MTGEIKSAALKAVAASNDIHLRNPRPIWNYAERIRMTVAKLLDLIPKASEENKES